jgi:hypothetical protein
MDARTGFQGRIFDNDGKYLRTCWPPAAADVGKLVDFGYEFATTVWGDKALMCGWFGPTRYPGDARKKPIEELGRVMFGLAGVEEYKAGPRPERIPPPKGPEVLRQVFGVKFVRMVADRQREELYVGSPGMGLLRLDGRTGALDETWFPGGELDKVSECHVGPDGLLYIRIGPHGYGLFIARLDHDGEPVDFGGDAIAMPPPVRHGLLRASLAAGEPPILHRRPGREREPDRASGPLRQRGRHNEGHRSGRRRLVPCLAASSRCE